MKWTQEQREKAERQWEAMMPKFTSYHNMGVELACQRNALLDALKDITNLACGWQGSYEWRKTVTQKAKDAIAKAEGK